MKPWYFVHVQVPGKRWEEVFKNPDEQMAIKLAKRFEPLEVKVTKGVGGTTVYSGGEPHASVSYILQMCK